jgi:hypothetical protein
MNGTDELINYTAIIAPIFLAALAIFFAGATPQRRLISVILPALCGILAVGFGLQGLTRACFPNQITCEQGFSIVEVIGNTFGDQMNCRVCAPPPELAPLAFTLNEYRPIVVIVAAVACCQLSLLSLVMFVRWMRRMERPNA